MVVSAERTRSRRTRPLVVYAVSLLGAVVLVFIVGGHGKNSSGSRPPTLMDESAAAAVLSASPLGDGDNRDSTAAPGTTSGTALLAETYGGETKGAPTGDGAAGTRTHPEPELDVTSGASSDGTSPDRVAVYVYDGIPELDHSDLVECYRETNGGVSPWQDEQADMAQDMGEIWLHRCVCLCVFVDTAVCVSVVFFAP